jgi:hypothetical protein
MVIESVSPVFASKCSDSAWTGRITFMGDEEDIWQVFFYWLLERHIDFAGLPADDAVSLAVRSACFADKYDIVELSDEAIAFLVDEKVEVSIEQLHLAFKTTSQDCPLREVLAEKTIAAVEAGKIGMMDLLFLDGTGFLPLYISFHGALHLCLEVDATKKASIHAGVLLHCFRGSRKVLVKHTSTS